jgi:hypothetical protein
MFVCSSGDLLEALAGDLDVPLRCGLCRFLERVDDVHRPLPHERVNHPVLTGSILEPQLVHTPPDSGHGAREGASRA